MGTVAMSGSDTIMINDRVLNDLADGNCVELTFPNDVATVKTGKNGNTIYGLNEMGSNCEVKVRLIRGSADDKFMNSLFAQQKANFAGFPLMIGNFIKKIGNGLGAIANDQYIMSGGVFTKSMEAKMNVEGEADQSTVTYQMKFGNSPRVIT